MLVAASPRIAPRFNEGFVNAACFTWRVIFGDAETREASVVSYVMFSSLTREDMWSIGKEEW